MIRPISQSLIQNISNPGQAQINQLNNTIQNLGQINRNNRLMQMQEQQQALQRRIQTAPIAKQFVDQAMQLGTPEERQEFFIKNKDTISQLGFYDYSDISLNDFTDETLAQVSNRLGSMGQQGLGAQARVQSTEFVPGGGARVVMSDGTVKFVKPDEQAIDEIRKGEERGAELQGVRSQKRQQGKDAASMSTKAFNQSRAIKANIGNLKEVISAVGDGANTGPLAKKLPNLRTASIKLDNIRSRLGLDIIGAVTFGALSEGELQLALDTALPTGLEGPELVAWAKEKIAAQEKLANYLESQAIFLGKSGNTVDKWIQHNQQNQAEPQAQPQTKTPQKVGNYTIEIVE